MIVPRKNIFSRLSLLVCLGAFALAYLLAASAPAHAAPAWGEFEHAFLQVSNLATGKEPGHVYTGSHTPAFAVDSSTGSFYVADEVETGAQLKFRIQRFDFNKAGKAEAKATVEFTTPSASKSGTSTAGEEVQLAVDPARDRVYALIVYKRREKEEKEEKEEEKECEEKGKCYERFPLDYEELVAGELYAFDYQGGQLVSAHESLPIIAESTFKPQAEVPKESLLNPRGMAVEPATGDLIITGQQDEQEDSKVEEEVGPRECRVTAQSVTVTESKAKPGELSGKLGHRYVDNESILEELTCEHEALESVPYSPVITAKGKLLVEETRSICPTEDCEGGEVWELPESTVKVGETANKIEEFASKPRLLYKVPAEHELVRFGAEGLAGPLMSYVPDSSSEDEEHGKLYLSGEIEEKGFNSSVLTLDYTEASGKEPASTELGWTGGGQGVGGAEGCSIPKPGGQAFLVGGFKETGAGGREGAVALDLFSSESIPQIEGLQFGPGGSVSGCPHVTVSVPSVKAGGIEVSPQPAEEVTLSSNVQGANAKSVEWQFEDITTEKSEAPVTDSAPQYQLTSFKHAFGEEGKYKVTEVVETDNLAYPSITQTREILVGHARPEFVILGPTSVLEGEEAKFEAGVEDENKNVTPLKYVWKFGDGGELKGETSGSSTTIEGKHLYTASCASCTVTLEVTDQEGATGVHTAKIVVKEKAKTGGGGGGGGGNGGNTGGGGSTGGGGNGGTTGGAPKVQPEATLAGTALSVSPAGALTLKVACPGGETSCAGTVTLRTASAVSVAKHKKKAVLTLASGSFEVAGGKVKVVVLHLSRKARALLAHIHTLRVRATLLAHDASGASHTTTTVLTLRLAKAARRKH